MGNYINRLIDGDNQAFDELYIKHKASFLRIVGKKFSLTNDEVMDLYHAACYALWSNVLSGKKGKDSIPDRNIRSYLVTTASNLWKQEHKKAGQRVSLDARRDDVENEIYARHRDDDPHFEEKIALISEAVDTMPMPCSKLLKLRHFDRKHHEEIAREMDYANADVAKNLVGRCMRKLKAYVLNEFERKGLC